MKYVLIALFTIFSLSGHAQYTEANSFMRKALVLYTMDNNGFYQKSTSVLLEKVSALGVPYAYDVKAQNLYVQTDNSNCVITLNKDYAKIIKKNKDIPQLKNEELENVVISANNELDEKFKELNMRRQKHIADSIHKAKEDSIEAARQDSIKNVRICREREDYRNSHDWHWIPAEKSHMSCSLCDYTVMSKDSVYCVGMKKDSLFLITFEDLALGINYLKVHRVHIPYSLTKSEKFNRHCEIYGDSLRADDYILNEDVAAINTLSFINALNKVQEMAPYGYFDDWGWDDSYSMLTFNFKYTNMNKKTIKYINVFFKVTNDVGDVRKTGNFRGTGPLEFLDTASWDWDSSSYFVAGDASNMNITKLIITYMDGSQKVLTGNQIKFN